MAKLKVYPSGLTAYQPSEHPRVPPVRSSACSGWSKGSTQRLIRWLYSVEVHALPRGLHAFTLTVRECPPTPNDWKRCREALFRRLLHQGVSRILWLTEWQRRGVPHLHGIVVLPAGFSACDLIGAWVYVARRWRPARSCQTCRAMFDPRGWNEYLAKHSARGVANYQRSSANIPEQWNGKTGRMWGYRGDWPTRDPMEIEIPSVVFFGFRRLLRRRAIADARGRRDWAALKYARAMLRHSDPKVSRVRGLSRFSSIDEALSLLDALSTKGKPSQ